jgi:hypothetical protein
MGEMPPKAESGLKVKEHGGRKIHHALGYFNFILQNAA